MNRLFFSLYYIFVLKIFVDLRYERRLLVGLAGEVRHPTGAMRRRAHHPPHGKRPLGPEINSFSVILFKRTFSVALSSAIPFQLQY